MRPGKLNRIFAISIAIAAFLSAPGAKAARFANQFVEFELPPQWQCNLEGAEWVCQNIDDGRKKDAIIVLAAKLKGDQDSLDQYRSYLKAPKIYQSVQGRPVRSEVKYVKDTNLSGQVWVDSLHLESEIPGFYTRYLATVKQDIGVLVTYSINRNKYQQYMDQFESMVNTLRVFRKPGQGINAAPQGANIFQAVTPPPGVSADSVFNPGGTNPVGGSDVQPTRPKSDLPWLPIGAAIAVVAFIIYKRRQNSPM